MGGGSAARIGFHHPELFDAVGVMGSPFSDSDSFWWMLGSNHLSGFCPRQQLLDVLAAHPDNPGILDQPDNPATWCGVHGADVPGDPALPDSACWLFRSDFNHWYRGPDAGRGGGFNRAELMKIIQDLAATNGNPSYHNPDSAYFPPGVTATHHVPPGLRGADREARRQDICANPVVIQGFKHHAYNPDGSFPVITFCDCASCAGEYTPGQANLPVEVLLAVDYNRNGRRDYAEPVLWMPHEPFQDVGPDGKAAGEPGDDPTDAYHFLHNPAGRAGNHRYDDGEPFEDVGLDGLPDTGDHGEGDGLFTLSPGMERALADGPRAWFQRMDPRMSGRVDLWMDAGLRDFINSAQVTHQLFAAVLDRHPDSRLHAGFHGLSGRSRGSNYDFTHVDFSPASVGRNAFLLYGDPDVCPGSDVVNGTGNHAGPAEEVLDRLMTLFAFVDARMPGGDRTYINSESTVDDHPDGFQAHVRMETYASTALGRDQEYGIVLPPGYHYPENAEKRYPVIYFLHGQGQSAENMLGSWPIFLGAMHQSSRTGEYTHSDLQKLILVFADGKCRGDECHTGNFYSDFVGVNGGGGRFESAFLELMRHVDGSYRTRFPEVH
jgi:hypothetical protein